MLGKNKSLEKIVYSKGSGVQGLGKLDKPHENYFNERGGVRIRFGKSESLGEIRKRNTSNESRILVRHSVSKKSCLKSNEEIGRQEINENSGKRVRFNPDLEVSHRSRITANSIITAVRQENTSLPEILRKKQLYTKLDEAFGFERHNRFYVKYFVSPKNGIVSRRKLRRLEMRNLSSK